MHKKCKPFHSLFPGIGVLQRKRQRDRSHTAYFHERIFIFDEYCMLRTPAEKPRRVPLSAESGRNSNHDFAGSAGEIIPLAE
jgi:hypothetical protein